MFCLRGRCARSIKIMIIMFLVMHVVNEGALILCVCLIDRLINWLLGWQFMSIYAIYELLLYWLIDWWIDYLYYLYYDYLILILNYTPSYQLSVHLYHVYLGLPFKGERVISKLKSHGSCFILSLRVSTRRKYWVGYEQRIGLRS